MAGILYLCATPIGNMEDMTFRVLDTLKIVDVIAAEDTRNTIRLLNRYEIKTPMTSYHEYNKTQKAITLIAMMKEGKNIALVTDAGTPAISDPGEVLVKMCVEEGITVTSLPGACACITALTLSGLATRRFCFEGFLPPDRKERNEILDCLKQESRTIVLYEAPHHLVKTLEELFGVLGDRQIALCRELTKKFEEIIHTSIGKAIEYYCNEEPRGEYVLVIEGFSFEDRKREREENFQKITVEEHYQMYLKQGIATKEAMKLVAKDRGISKRDVYQEIMVNQ